MCKKLYSSLWVIWVNLNKHNPVSLGHVYGFNLCTSLIWWYKLPGLQNTSWNMQILICNFPDWWKPHNHSKNKIFCLKGNVINIGTRLILPDDFMIN